MDRVEQKRPLTHRVTGVSPYHKMAWANMTYLGTRIALQRAQPQRLCAHERHENPVRPASGGARLRPPAARPHSHQSDADSSSHGLYADRVADRGRDHRHSGRDRDSEVPGDERQGLLRRHDERPPQPHDGAKRRTSTTTRATATSLDSLQLTTSNGNIVTVTEAHGDRLVRDVARTRSRIRTSARCSSERRPPVAPATAQGVVACN